MQMKCKCFLMQGYIFVLINKIKIINLLTIINNNDALIYVFVTYNIDRFP